MLTVVTAHSHTPRPLRPTERPLSGEALALEALALEAGAVDLVAPEVLPPEAAAGGRGGGTADHFTPKVLSKWKALLNRWCLSVTSSQVSSLRISVGVINARSGPGKRRLR